MTAGIVSLFHAVPLLSGPVASALTDRYGCRKMTILGSLLATAGFLLSSVANSIEVLYLTFGIMSGKPKLRVVEQLQRSLRLGCGS